MSALQLINEKIGAHDVFVFSKSYCPYCKSAIKILQENFGSAVEVFHIEDREDVDELQDELLKMTDGRSVPRIFIKGKFVGGCDDITLLAKKGELKSLL